MENSSGYQFLGLSKSHPGPVVHISDSPMDERKELCTWEEELMWAALQQKNLEELLWRREQELAEQEIDILGWELNIILHQLCQEKPQLKKHVGKFRKKSWLKIKDGNRISLPSADFQQKFTVQASPSMNKRKSLISSHSSPPANPTIIPHLRAIQCQTIC
ncbi:mitogen-activated protein kinase kinase kinase 9-like isoform X10 [Tamandua tetradactyla]|uniref:mitogen-activated protein kinase kinase kinase 9-like isoform X10 n=1 Tax=Tamandua tetradactyla TaxID=48850 RepID=UPI004054642F